jgi:hypothetical protein
MENSVQLELNVRMSRAEGVGLKSIVRPRCQQLAYPFLLNGLFHCR